MSEREKLKDVARDLLVAYVSGDTVIQAVRDDYPEADQDEILRLRNELMDLVQTATVSVTWPDDERMRS